MVQKFIFLLRSPVRNSCWRNATDVANIFHYKKCFDSYFKYTDNFVIRPV